MFEAGLHTASEVLGSPVRQIDASILWEAGVHNADWVVICAAEHVHRFGRDFVAAGLDRMHPAGRAFMEYGLTISIDDYMAARRRRFDYVLALDLLLGDDAVLFTPTVNAAGFLADGRLDANDEPWSVPGHVYNTELANLTGHPSMSIPAGVSGNGVPFGLQVIAPRFHDGWLLDLAARWEERRPWPRTAPGFDSFETAFGL
jgi:Asp-tRNA(Asn)/Glu-tRNA(Gln) amidotransferase A subunit family amidase